MILTFKIKHNCDLSTELAKAKEIAQIAVKTRIDSSKDVGYIGLKSLIANQILRKYGGSRKARKVTSVKLIIPNQGISVNKEKKKITVPCLSTSVIYYFRNDFEKINQIEADETYFYVSASFKEVSLFEPKGWLGVDLNTSGHCVVVANPLTGKVLKMGKEFAHVRMKYLNLRKNIQKSRKYKLLKKIRNREQSIIRDLNHKISKKLVDYAYTLGLGIRLETLKGIQKRGRRQRKQRQLLHTWTFYQLQTMVEYKAKMNGVPVEYVLCFHTSSICSKCGVMGFRSKKDFSCISCGHVDNADVNAAFNIAKRQSSSYQLCADRDVHKGNTGVPKEAMARMLSTSKSS